MCRRAPIRIASSLAVKGPEVRISGMFNFVTTYTTCATAASEKLTSAGRKRARASVDRTSCAACLGVREAKDVALEDAQGRGPQPVRRALQPGAEPQARGEYRPRRECGRPHQRPRATTLAKATTSQAPDGTCRPVEVTDQAAIVRFRAEAVAPARSPSVGSARGPASEAAGGSGGWQRRWERRSGGRRGGVRCGCGGGRGERKRGRGAEVCHMVRLLSFGAMGRAPGGEGSGALGGGAKAGPVCGKRVRPLQGSALRPDACPCLFCVFLHSD